VGVGAKNCDCAWIIYRYYRFHYLTVPMCTLRIMT